VIRTRLREEKGVNRALLKYGSIMNTFKVIAREEGIRGLYGGMGTHLIRVVPNSAIMFLTYETVSHYLSGRVA
jgi:solute carrier family 25, member 33/36